MVFTPQQSAARLLHFRTIYNEERVAAGADPARQKKVGSLAVQRLRQQARLPQNQNSFLHQHIIYPPHYIGRPNDYGVAVGDRFHYQCELMVGCVHSNWSSWISTYHGDLLSLVVCGQPDFAVPGPGQITYVKERYIVPRSSQRALNRSISTRFPVRVFAAQSANDEDRGLAEGHNLRIVYVYQGTYRVRYARQIETGGEVPDYEIVLSRRAAQ